jgi:biopolymer transport protein TolR
MAFHMNTNRRAAMSDINVTPLVDVMLVLLIIFMVTAPMMQEGVTVDLPRVQDGKPVPKDHQSQEIVIAVQPSGKIYLNDVAVQESELTQKVADSTKNNPSRSVYLRADQAVPYGLVARIMTALQGAGVTNLNLITKPMQGPPKQQ